MKIQELYNQALAQKKLILPPGEWAGPLHIRHSMVIEGPRATLWSQSGPALIIDADRVIVRNISVEALGESDLVAIEVRGQRRATFQDVKIRGRVAGIPGESEKWPVPKLLELGALPAQEASQRTIRVHVPVPCRVESKISGLRLSPEHLQIGSNEISIHIDPLPAHTLLWGELVIHSLFQRSITVTATTTTEAVVSEKRPLWVPSAEKEQVDRAKKAPPSKSPPSASLLRGQRVDLSELCAGKNKCTIAVGWTVERKNFEVDSAVFALGSHQKVRHDQDLLFYGNPSNEYLALKKATNALEQEHLELELAKVPSEIERLVLTLSIYEAEERRQNFSYFSTIYLRLLVDEASKEVEVFRFDLSSAFVLETAIVLGEIYRYKDHWRFSAVGAGYHGGLKALCETYGINVVS
ncbi:hypothetical protein F9B85_08035 [Heliorestis acidaminivorans]|uniref:TerD domain-containing protein n=1 Tax=Heliorestis acidaminivorans TaxID=553427 RepID=A0A6I0F2B0_9FIRM|nr:TerD family protein [Heliorestis acidaminivorans]KAB2952603.1 hypothetical protein F9B85_08035 [Heliorestis acidaminivorans]